MKIIRKLFAGLMAVILMGSAFGHVSLSQADAATVAAAEYGTESIRSLETTSRLRELALLIDYYDEVLTQSARNYAFTQDKKWKRRYRESEPKLIAALEEALEKGDRIDIEFLERIDKANLKLVEMEYRSIEHVNAGQTQQAVALIPGQYVPVRLTVGQNPDALLIPARALVESQIGNQVYVVCQDNKVESRTVEVGRSYQHQWIITKGLKKGEKVIVEGTQKVRPGVVVNPKPYSAKKT